MDDVQSFYDDLAPDYHALHVDWDASVRRQGVTLARLVERLKPGASTVLDATCGIGTQAIGLALEGYQVTGTDLSPSAVARARTEATRIGIQATFAATDIRTLASVAPGPFDVVLSADNALAHLTEPADMVAALENVYQVLAPGSLFLASFRDYDAVAPGRPGGEPPRVSGVLGSRHMTAQAWEWEEGKPIYRAHLFVARESSRGWTTRHFETRLWAIARNDFAGLALEAGLIDGHWLEAAETDFYQPIFAAWRPA